MPSLRPGFFLQLNLCNSLPLASLHPIFVFGSQVHGAVARVVTRADRGAGAAVADEGVGEADALVTSDPGTVLGAVVADCVPILLYDPISGAAAAVHAGWRGTGARIVAKAVGVLQADYAVRPQSLRSPAVPGR